MIFYDVVERKQYLDNFIEYNETTMYEFIVSDMKF